MRCRIGGVAVIGPGLPGWAESEAMLAGTAAWEVTEALPPAPAILAAAGYPPEDIDHVNFHGTGTRANDAMEDRAVHHVFGGAVPCSSTKGWTGHTLGASGALEAVAAVLCVEDGLVPGCLGVDEADPEFRSDVATANRAVPVRRVLSNSFGFGGSNCSLVIGRAGAA